MARRYVIERGDTLAKIAKRFYGDVKLFAKLASFNGLSNPSLIQVGQGLEIPSRAELEGETETTSDLLTPVAPGLAAPKGLDAIKATFGDIEKFIGSDGGLNPQWEQQFIGRATLPFPIPLSWALTQKVTRFQCHTKLSGVFEAVFKEIQGRGLQSKVKTFGGCYAYRPKRTSTKLSTHSWGIAIDLNPLTNEQGTSGDMAPGVIEVFKGFGFTWGGDWSGKSKDPMHFQFCSGY